MDPELIALEILISELEEELNSISAGLDSLEGRINTILKILEEPDGSI